MTKKNNIAQKTIIKFVQIYQKYISPDHSFWAKDNPPYCQHIPSCSEYMIEAVEKKGAFKGFIKGFFRIMRCMPWNKGGYDPVDNCKAKECTLEGKK